jgi:hypothetical protein
MARVRCRSPMAASRWRRCLAEEYKKTRDALRHRVFET